MDYQTTHLQVKKHVKTLTLTIRNGNTTASETIEIPKGIKVLAAAKTYGTVAQILNLGLFEQGQELNTPMDISFWRDKEIGQKFYDGFVETETSGNNQLEARLISPNGPVNSDITVQVVFVIIQASC